MSAALLTCAGPAAAQTTPTVSWVRLNWSALGAPQGENGTYIAGDFIFVTLAFSQPVTVTGTPLLALTVGSITRDAIYDSQWDPQQLLFIYEVRGEDKDSNGVSIGATALSLNGGTIQNGEGIAANLDLGTHAVSDDERIVVDGSGTDTVVPTVSHVSLSGTGQGENRAFVAGNVIQVSVYFSEPLTVTGTPRLALTIGSNTRQAEYVPRMGTNVGTNILNFNYTVMTADRDDDGISIGATALSLNGGTISDRVGNAANLGLGTHAVSNRHGFVVDGSETDPVVPTVASVWLSGTARGENGAFVAGDVIRVGIGFSEVVTVVGSPQVALTIGSNTRQAEYVSGSGSTQLSFHYTVVTADSDDNGVSIGATALSLNGATIRDGANNNANLGLGTHAVTDNDRFTVDGSGTARGPTVAGVSLSGTGSGNNGVFIAGDVIRVTVQFSEKVTVAGTPQVALTIGSKTRQADYFSGSGSTDLSFRYTVVAQDDDSDGVSVGGTALSLNGGTIRALDLIVLDANLSLTGHEITNDSQFAVWTTAPVVSYVRAYGIGRGANGTFIAEDEIWIVVSFSDGVTVTGTPRLALTIGSATRYATYHADLYQDYPPYGRFLNVFFRYKVEEGDRDSDGISIGATALSLNGGTIRDLENDADLDLGAHVLSDFGTVVVDGSETDTVAPTVTDMRIFGGNESGFDAGDTVVRVGALVRVFVEFSEQVTVVGTPQVALTIGSETRQADYFQARHDFATPSSPFRSTMEFRYTVEEGDTDSDGISIGGSALSLNGGAIRDKASPPNDASLSLTGHTITNRVIVDGTSLATVTSVILDEGLKGRGVNGAYIADDVIGVVVNFSKPVTVNGTPRLELTIGSRARRAEYVSGSGTNALVFHYTVVRGDRADGISATVLLPDGVWGGNSILDRANNRAAVLILPDEEIENAAAIKVVGDGSDPAPTVTGVRFADTPGKGSGGAYIDGDLIRTVVVFSEPVTVTGTPRLALTVGNETQYAEWNQSESRGTEQVFDYTVEEGDRDTDGVSIGATALELNGATIRDRRNNAVLRLTGLDDLRKVVVLGTTLPEVVSVSFDSEPDTGTDNTYYEGSVISVAVTYSEKVLVSGHPKVRLSIGSITRDANFVAPSEGGARERLLFRYQAVTSDDVDRDGISVGSLVLGGARIRDEDGSNVKTAFGAHAIVNDGSHKVDGSRRDETAPRVTGVTVVGGRGTYRRGQDLRLKVSFSEPTYHTGRPVLPIRIGGRIRNVEWTQVSENLREHEFHYEVQEGDAAPNGISVGDVLILGTATLVDAAQNPASLSLTKIEDAGSYRVDGSTQSEEAVSLETIEVASAPDGETYAAGDTVEIIARFSARVVVNGRPSIEVTLEATATAGQSPVIRRGQGGAPGGARVVEATYTRSSPDGRNLFFEYTVQADDRDADGITIGRNALRLTGGATITNAVGVAAETVLEQPVEDVYGQRIGGGASGGGGSDAARLLSVRITSTPRQGRTYRAGETIEALAQFSESVTISDSTGLLLSVGTEPRIARYVQGSGTDRVLFRYVVVAADEDTNGVSIPESPIARGSVGTTDGAPVTLIWAGLPDDDDHLVDGGSVPPPPPSGTLTVDRVSVVSFPSNGIAYGAGETIAATVEFSGPVSVSGTPQLALTVGERRRPAAYASGSGSSTLRFAYEVQAADWDEDGVGIPANALTGTISGGSGQRVDLTHAAVASDDAHQVRGMEPLTVRDVRISSSPPDGVAYRIGQTITITVEFSDEAEVNGTPTLPFTLGPGTRSAVYAGGAGTRELRFTYRVVEGDWDEDGISVPADSVPETVVGASGQRVDLAHPALPDQEDHPVRGVSPPEAVGTLPALTLIAGEEPRAVEVADAFRGAETYRADSSAAAVAAVTLAQTTLTVSPLTEGEAEVTVTASNRAGSATQTFGVTVVPDPAEAAVVAETLSVMGRGLLSSATEVIGRRMEGNGGGESRVSMSALSSGFGGGAGGRAARGARELFLGERPIERAAAHTGYDRLRDNFAISFATGQDEEARDRGLRWTLWSAGDFVSVGGGAEGSTYSGDLRTPYLGADLSGERWLAGVALARSWGRADYEFAGVSTGTGSLSQRLTNLYPYARFQLTERSEVWTILGVGSGSVDLERGERGNDSAALAMRMGIVGMRQQVTGSGRGLGVAIRWDAGLTRLTTGEGAGAAGNLSADASRLRLGVETRYRGDFGDSGSIEPFAAVSGRSDSDQSGSGRGVEVSGGLRLNAGSRFRLEAQGRMLAAYSEEGFRERGVGITASLSPGSDGRGLSMSLAPRWGGSASQSGALWRGGGDPFSSRGGFRQPEGGTVDAQLGYGFAPRRLPGLLTPFSDFSYAGDRRQMRLGLRYGALGGGGPRSFDLEFSGERGAYGDQTPTLRLSLMGSLRF